MPAFRGNPAIDRAAPAHCAGSGLGTSPEVVNESRGYGDVMLPSNMPFATCWLHLGPLQTKGLASTLAGAAPRMVRLCRGPLIPAMWSPRISDFKLAKHGDHPAQPARSCPLPACRPAWVLLSWSGQRLCLPFALSSSRQSSYPPASYVASLLTNHHSGPSSTRSMQMIQPLPPP
jgi:hypothetical protein